MKICLDNPSLNNLQMTHNEKHSPKIHRIKVICTERVDSGDFVEFANQLISLGIVRQTYDVLSDCLYFYSKDALLTKFPMSEICISKKERELIVGDQLDIDELKSAINSFDKHELSVNEFHLELAKAGIVYVSVNLDKQIIYYLSQDSNHYIETY